MARDLGRELICAIAEVNKYDWVCSHYAENRFGKRDREWCKIDNPQ